MALEVPMSLQASHFPVPTPAQTLRRQLSQFGLNPEEWHVLPLTTGEYCAIHHIEADFVLIGSVCLRELEARWESLEVLDDGFVA